MSDLHALAELRLAACGRCLFRRQAWEPHCWGGRACPADSGGMQIGNTVDPMWFSARSS
jgi:hypothetical protein